MKKILLLICFLVTLIQNHYAQETSTSKFFEIGTGIGISDGKDFTGGGFNFSFSIRKTFRNQRLFFHPGMDISMMGSRMVMDVPDQYFNSMNFDLLFGFDFLRFQGLSLYLNAGPDLNIQKGLLGTGGYPPGRTSSDYMTGINPAISFGGGIRFENKEGNAYVILSPMNFRVGNQYFMEGFAKMSFGRRF